MQIHSINSNRQESFTGGIHHRIFDKAIKDGGNYDVLMNKANEINGINNPNYTITHVIYNAKEKYAEFLLSVRDIMKFVPGMETIKPQPIISKGENVAEALLNIDKKQLLEANEALENSYTKQFNETEKYRKKVLAEHQQRLVDLQNKYNEFRSFWSDFYKRNK